jgi:hypothetical protein
LRYNGVKNFEERQYLLYEYHAPAEQQREAANDESPFDFVVSLAGNWLAQTGLAVPAGRTDLRKKR